MTSEFEEFRPRYGRVLRADGSRDICYFRPVKGETDLFEPVDASTEELITLNPGDTIAFDRLGAHQGIRVLRDDNEMHEGRTRPGWRNVMDDKAKEAGQPAPAKSDVSWGSIAKGFIVLFGLAGFALGLVWGITAIVRG